MSTYIDFNAVPNGTLLDAAGLGFTKLTSSSANTIVVNSGKLDFVGVSFFATYAYETGQTNHSFAVTWGGSGLGSNAIPCCIRINNFQNFLYARITATNNLEIGKCVAGATTTYSGGTIAISRTAADVVKLAAVGDVITCYLNGTQVFQVTDSTFNTSTKVGLCSRTNANVGVIDAVEIDFVSVTSINGGSAIPAGKTGVPAVTAGYSGLPLSITTDNAGVTCSNIGGTTNAPTFDISDRSDGVLYPKDGASVNFTLTRNSEISSLSQVISKKSTETKTVLSSPITSDATYLAGAIYSLTLRTLATGDEVYYTVPVGMSDLVIATDSGITVTNTGSFDCWIYINGGADAGKNYYYRVTVAAGGAVVAINGLTVAGLTTSGLTSAGLSVAGL